MKLYLNLFLILLTTIIAYAQEDDPKVIKDMFWGTNDSYKNKTEIHDKWKNESAVVIYKNVNYDFHKFAKKVTYTSSVRMRIKLLDKAAIEDYSEFSFNDKFWVRKMHFDTTDHIMK